jgi:hypothetical protein
MRQPDHGGMGRKIEMTKDKRVRQIICRLNYLTWLLEQLAA